MKVQRLAHWHGESNPRVELHPTTSRKVGFRHIESRLQVNILISKSRASVVYLELNQSIPGLRASPGRQPCVPRRYRLSRFALRRGDPRQQTRVLPLLLHLLLPGSVLCGGRLLDPDRIPAHVKAAEREERGADNDLYPSQQHVPQRYIPR